MTDPDAPVIIGSSRYDTTRPLATGQVALDGIPSEVRTEAVVSDVFRRMIVDEEYTASELGWTFLLRLLEQGDDRFVGIPVFPNRVFRHSCIFVNVDSGIEHPEDLAGATVGEFALWGQDSGVWAKGMLADEYGYRPQQSRWVIGGLDRAMAPFDFVPGTHPDDVEVRVETGHALAELLAAGELDALISANVPQLVRDGSTRIRPLFPDAAALELDWFRRTGIYPAMHLIVVRRDALAARPDLAQRLYEAFDAAKEAAADVYREGRRVFQAESMIPWLMPLFEDVRDVFGDDWFPYGVSRNRAMIDAMLRYHHEQGITRRRYTAEDVFVPELLGT